MFSRSSHITKVIFSRLTGNINFYSVVCVMSRRADILISPTKHWTSARRADFIYIGSMTSSGSVWRPKEVHNLDVQPRLVCPYDVQPLNFGLGHLFWTSHEHLWQVQRIYITNKCIFFIYQHQHCCCQHDTYEYRLFLNKHDLTATQ